MQWGRVKVLEIFESKDAAVEGQALAKHILDRYTSSAKPLAELNPESAHREATLEVDRVSASTAETSEPSNVHMSEEEDDSEGENSCA